MKSLLPPLVALTLLACRSPPAAIDAGPALDFGAVCDPTLGTDPCLSGGFLCSATANFDGGSCQFPTLGQPCLQSSGCQPDGGDSCFAFPGEINHVTGGALFLCGTPCGSGADCDDPATDCFPAARNGKDGGACEFSFCTDITQPCTIAGASGNCVPASTTGNICIQDGTAALGAACASTRAAGGAHLCGSAAFCLQNLSFNGGVCIGLCLGASMTCTASTHCDQRGICLTACDGNPSVCPPPLSCQALDDGAGGDGGSDCLP